MCKVGIFSLYKISLFFFFYFIIIFLFLAVLGLRFCARAFLQLQQAGATLHRGARASHYRSLSCCGAQAPDAQAQQLWLTGPAALRHVGFSQTRARTCVPCIGRQILNHCATREAPIRSYSLTDILKNQLTNYQLLSHQISGSQILACIRTTCRACEKRLLGPTLRF